MTEQRKGLAMLQEQFVGRPVASLPTPALVVDEERLEANLGKMARFLAGGPTRLRPHAKSHKCSALARRQVALGALGMTCATVEEAEAMAAAGIRDVLIANEVVNPYWVGRLAQLASRCDLKVAVDCALQAEQLARAAQGAGATLGVVIEVDVGMGRCGCQPGEPVVELAGAVTRLAGLRFRGLMGYEGHAVGIADAFERGVVCRTSLSLLTATADLLRARGFSVEIVSAGGTGTHDVAGRLPGITEIQAGSYALMDLQYRGIAPQFACALTILSTVISRPTRDRAVTDAGLKSMTTEFGLPVVVDRPGVVLKDLSEEHGILEVEPSVALGPGETLALFPTHSCTTVSLHPYLYLVRDGIVREVWAVDGGRGRGHRAL